MNSFNEWYSGASLDEVLRYAGVRDARLCDGALREDAARAVHEVGECAVPRERWLECILSLDGARCSLDGTVFESRDLAEHLRGCERALLFAATLGSDVDRLIARWSAVKMSHALLLQAAAAALIEYHCDRVNERLETRYASEGLWLRPRYSPGYGDFPLECQRALTDRLQAFKYIGVTVSGGGQLTPMKTVTAVIGVTRQRQQGRTGSCASGKCARCPHTSCAFRKI